MSYKTPANQQCKEAVVSFNESYSWEIVTHMIVRVMHLLLVDNEVSDAEMQQVQQLIDTLHAHVHSSDVLVRNSIYFMYRFRFRCDESVCR